MREKVFNHAGFPGPVKIEDMERTSMYRDYLAQIKGDSDNTAAVKETPGKNFAGSKPELPATS